MCGPQCACQRADIQAQDGDGKPPIRSVSSWIGELARLPVSGLALQAFVSRFVALVLRLLRSNVKVQLGGVHGVLLPLASVSTQGGVCIAVCARPILGASVTTRIRVRKKASRENAVPTSSAQASVHLRTHAWAGAGQTGRITTYEETDRMRQNAAAKCQSSFCTSVGPRHVQT
jgi:hypothetical protein